MLAAGLLARADIGLVPTRAGYGANGERAYGKPGFDAEKRAISLPEKPKPKGYAPP